MTVGQDGVERDLLGDPVRPIRDPRGRPSYAKTKENQRLVITLRAAQWSQEEIATFIGCDPKTLRKNFSRELDHAVVLLDGMALQILVGEMLKGSVVAAKEVRRFTGLRPSKDVRNGTGEAKPAAVGKKAAAAEAAKRAPRSWDDVLQMKPN